jgi:hypothetical protein
MKVTLRKCPPLKIMKREGSLRPKGHRNNKLLKKNKIRLSKRLRLKMIINNMLLYLMQ